MAQPDKAFIREMNDCGAKCECACSSRSPLQLEGFSVDSGLNTLVVVGACPRSVPLANFELAVLASACDVNSVESLKSAVVSCTCLTSSSTCSSNGAVSEAAASSLSRKVS